MDEEAVDFGGPRREFLQLLMEALVLSPLFEGRDSKLNLALDSSALREDWYFHAGRAITVSLLHGGPPPGFFSPTLYSCLVGGKSSVKPVSEDIADANLYEKVKKLSSCMTNPLAQTLFAYGKHLYQLPQVATADTYDNFRESMDFALGNTQGFSRQ
ncbi:uncharacterized protein LOC120559387 isoform X1 [Tachysurus ichikawai]